MKWGFAALAAALAAITLFCAHRPPPPNIILISIDTLRADHLGCYGYARKTPAIDAFRTEGVLFETAIASAPSTLASHASLFTALPPQHHGASHFHAVPLGAQFTTLTELLRDAGYRTAAFVGGGQLSPEYGVNQGFESYEVVDDGTFQQVVARAKSFLESAREKPFFLFLHTYEIHHPYYPRPEDQKPSASTLMSYVSVPILLDINDHKLRMSAADGAHIVSSYDGEIASMGRGFAFLMATLRKLDLYDNSLIVFTSDHGEEFTEHGSMGWHAHTLYDELLHIPLLVRFPNARHRGVNVAGMVRNTDIAPLILEAAGIPRIPPFDKFSLATTLKRGRAPASAALLLRESFSGEPSHDGLRTADWKLTEEGLYDLRGDPREQKNVEAQHPDVARELRAKLAVLLRERPRPSTRAITPDDETAARLRALGYLH